MIGRWLLCALAGLATAPPAPAQDEPDDGRGADARPLDPILARVPESLPRAEPDRWATFFENVDPDEIARRVGADAVGDLARAERAYQLGDFPGAIAILFPLLEARPDMPPALLVLGTTYFRLRRYGDTITCLERFLEVAPTEIWRTQVLGHSYYSLGRYAEAREHYEQVVARLPDSPEAIRGLALSEMRLGDFERALELLGRVVEVEPDNWAGHAWRAQVLWELGQLEAALAAAETARDLVPHEPRPWFLLKNILWELGRDEQADRAEARWRELDALAQEIRSVRGRLLFDPTNFELARRWAELCARVGDEQGAREALDMVVRAIPPTVRRVDVYVYALDLLWDMGDREGARVAAAALERDCAGEAAAWRRLELHYALTGDRKNQIEAGERYRRMADGDF